MPKMTLADIDVKGNRILVRVDFNVPIRDSKVISDERLKAAVPTISYLLEHGGRVILISHLGRPKGRWINELSLRPCAIILSDLLGKDVIFLDNCVGHEVRTTVNNLLNGQIVLLENLRFHKQERQNDITFAKELAGLGDIYVNDAFGTIHRAHASIVGVTKFINYCVMGFLVDKELSCIGKVMTRPKRPFIALLGGSKISGKLNVIINLLPKVDLLILGGAMAFTFLKAKRLGIGKSLFEADKVSVATKLLKDFKNKIILPSDCLVTNSFDRTRNTFGNTKYVSVNAIECDWFGIDIGKETILKFSDVLSTAKTILWNGPLGIFETPKAARGTFSIARAVANAAKNGATTVVGGGDSSLAIKRAGVIDDIFHISTGGGALLRFIGRVSLPGITALTDRS